MVSEMRFQCSLFLAKLQTVWVSLPLMVRPWKASELCGENDLNRGQTKKLFKTFFVPSESDPTWCDVREIRPAAWHVVTSEIRHVVTSERDPQSCHVRDSPCFVVRERFAMWRQGKISHVVTPRRDPQSCDVREIRKVVTLERFAMFCRQKKIHHVVTSE